MLEYDFTDNSNFMVPVKAKIIVKSGNENLISPGDVPPDQIGPTIPEDFDIKTKTIERLNSNLIMQKPEVSLGQPNRDLKHGFLKKLLFQLFSLNKGRKN